MKKIASKIIKLASSPKLGKVKKHPGLDERLYPKFGTSGGVKTAKSTRYIPDKPIVTVRKGHGAPREAPSLKNKEVREGILEELKKKTIQEKLAKIKKRKDFQDVMKNRPDPTNRK